MKLPLLGLALLLWGGAFLAACRSDEPVANDQTNETADDLVVTQTIEVTRVVVAAATPEPDEAAAPQSLIVCTTQEPESLYPYSGSAFPSSAIQHAVYEDLFTNLSFAYQARGLEKLPSLADGDAVLRPVEVAPGDRVVTLAQQVVTLQADGTARTASGELVEEVALQGADGRPFLWDGQAASMEQMVVRFTLKPMVWSDGEPVTADDAVYSFELAAASNAPAAQPLMRRTASFVAVGDLSLEWTALPGYLDPTYFLNIWLPLPRHAWGHLDAGQLREAEIAARYPLSSGPFVVTEWQPGRYLEMARNEHYYRAGLPKLDRVTFRFVSSPSQLLVLLLSNQCDVAVQEDIALDQLPSILEAEAAGRLRAHFQIGTAYEQISFNLAPTDGRTAWFADARVRQAMTLCADRQRMVDEILHGRSEILHSYIPAAHPLYPAGEIIERPYDPDQANQLLDEAGFTAGSDGLRRHPDNDQPFIVTLETTAGNPLRARLAEQFQQDMAGCGIEVALHTRSPEEWFAPAPQGDLFGRRYDLAAFGWLAAVEPPCHLFAGGQIPAPANNWRGLNNTGWDDPAYNQFCAAAQNALPGMPAYIENHQAAQRRFAEQAPVIPLFPHLKMAVTRPNIHNIALDPTQRSPLYNIAEIESGDRR